VRHGVRLRVRRHRRLNDIKLLLETIHHGQQRLHALIDVSEARVVSDETDAPESEVVQVGDCLLDTRPVI
jgi:hypothetical protein